ncbi:hypothetical protein Acry_0523 [Acidiphilium cryptum JF-5]|jgi:hypothetical protein|uniref:Uncharacterized protein n=2 Tax=Acidocellaceae TaxID=3385905 RepID=A5FVW5_ACICJ|nr:hypothetical protein Acry_0523 [Acidiphilium cryptum JF-5]
MIPRRIHQFWLIDLLRARRRRFGGGSPWEEGMQEELRANHLEWSLHHPGFEVKLWSLDELLSLCRVGGFTWVAQVLTADAPVPLQLDLIRFFLLEQLGGIWADLTVRPVGPMPAALLAAEFVAIGVDGGAPVFDQRFLAARPGLECFMRATDKVMRGGFDEARRMSGQDALAAAFAASRRPVAACLLSEQDTWGSLLERRSLDRDADWLPDPMATLEVNAARPTPA